MNTPVREGETIEGSRTMRNRPYPTSATVRVECPVLSACSGTWLARPFESLCPVHVARRSAKPTTYMVQYRPLVGEAAKMREAGVDKLSLLAASSSTSPLVSGRATFLPTSEPR